MSEHKLQITHWPKTKGIDALVLCALLAVAVCGIALTGRMELAPAKGTEEPVETLAPVESQITPETVPEIEPAPPEPAPQAPVIVEDSPEIDVPTVETFSADNGKALITLMGEKLNEGFWKVSQHANENSFYSVDWKRENITGDTDGISLSLKRDATIPRGYSGGELKTKDVYGYGTYEAIMRPARGSGVVSAFFTYTGPYNGNPHDEIDFEFLGSDLTQVYLNYWRNGKTGDDQTIDLGFDAGAEPHLYAFEWREDGIVWKVDGKVIHQTPPGDAYIPRTFGHAFFSIWTGTERVQAWHGPPTFEDGTQADVSCFSFVPQGGQGRSCGDFYLPKKAENTWIKLLQMSR